MTKNLLLHILTTIFCAALITSNIIAQKLWLTPLGVVLTSATLLFPIVYIVGDIVPEVYGLQAARRLIWFGFLANIISVAFFSLSITLPAPAFYENQSAFASVLSVTPRLLFASLVAYLVGTNFNAWVMVRIRTLTKGKFLWLRTIASTIAGEGVDSFLFIGIAFFGGLPLNSLLELALWQVGFKVAYEVVATPFTYAIINFVKRLP